MRTIYLDGMHKHQKLDKKATCGSKKKRIVIPNMHSQYYIREISNLEW